MPSVEDSAIFPTLSSSVILSGASANRAQPKDPVLTTHLAHRNKGFPRLRCASLGVTNRKCDLQAGGTVSRPTEALYGTLA